MDGHLAFVHHDGKKSITDIGVYYTCINPKSFRFKEDFSLRKLKEIICELTMSQAEVYQLCYRSPYLNETGVLNYKEELLLYDADVRQVFATFVNFKQAGPIEFYATFTRSVDEIMSLLVPPTKL